MKTVVLGGLDSAVALALQPEGYVADTLTVFYGQRHYRELDAATKIADHYHVPNTRITVDPVLFGGSALTNPAVGLPTTPATEPDSTYVPARNTVLLALAAARAETLGVRRVVIGANHDDADGYPDCRRRYIEAFRDVLIEGTVGHVWIEAPLLSYTKTDIINCAKDLHVPIHLTWSCYAGGDEPCGTCGACRLREQALA